jgi:hypothetical protein
MSIPPGQLMPAVTRMAEAADDFQGKRVPLAAAVLSLGALFPIATPVLLCYSRVLLGWVGRRFFWIYAVLFSLLVSLLNAGKLVEADERTYLQFLRYIHKNLGNGFLEAVLDGTGRTEWGFYSISYLLYSWTDGAIKPVVIFWTFLTYLLVAVSFRKLFREECALPRALPVFVASVLPFVNFVLTAQVTRQYAAGAMVLTAFAYFDRRVMSLFLILAATSIHNSAIVFLAPWMASAFLMRSMQRVPPLWLLVAGFAVLMVAGNQLRAIADDLTGDLMRVVTGSLLDNGALTLFKIATISFAVLAIHYRMKADFSRQWLPIYVSYVALAAILALVWKLPLFLLRFSFYVEFFAAMIIAMALFRLTRGGSLIAIAVLPLVANLVFLLRAASSPWTYEWLGGGVLDNFVGGMLVRALGG